MRLPFRHPHHEPTEVPCPRCKLPVPADDTVCNACGWDLRDAYREPEGDAAVDPHVTTASEGGESPAG